MFVNLIRTVTLGFNCAMRTKDPTQKVTSQSSLFHAIELSAAQDVLYHTQYKYLKIVLSVIMLL